jgi:hypothetical protein
LKVWGLTVDKNTAGVTPALLSLLTCHSERSEESIMSNII